MALSKRTLKHRNHVNKAPFLLVLSAALRMNETAEAYNATAQQGLSSKHHPEQAFRDAVRLYRAGLWDDYNKAKTVFNNRRRKYGDVFTRKVVRTIGTKPVRNLEADRIGLSKPGWARKKVASTTNPYVPRPVIMSEHVDADKVGEMSFAQAVVLFKHHIVQSLVSDKHMPIGEALNLADDFDNHKEVLLEAMNNLIEKEELKVMFVRHKKLMSSTPYNITKITDV